MDQLKIIKTGSLSMEVEDFQSTREKFENILSNHKAFIANEQLNRPHNRTESRIVIKVLPNQFQPLISSLETLALRIHGKQIHTQDVTQEYTDIAARLTAKESVAQRYKDILKSAKNVEEILHVEDKLRIVLEEIESLKGRTRYLNEQIGLSTLTVTMFQYLPVAEIAEAGFFTKFGQAITFGWNDILGIVLGLAANWHLILIFGFIFFFGRKMLWSRRGTRSVSNG